MSESGKISHKFLKLSSSPGAYSDNYTLSTGTNDAETNYSLSIRRRVVEQRLSGTTKDIKLTITPADSGTDELYDMNCEISR